MGDEALRVHSRCRDRRSEPLGALRPNGRLIPVEFRDCREQLHRRHAGLRGTSDRHVDPAFVDGVGAEPMLHALGVPLKSIIFAFPA